MSDKSISADNAILESRDLVAGYGKSQVLHRVSMEVRAGEIVTMVGANGAGKSTVLRSIFGLTDIRSGVVRFKGQDITGARPHHIVAMGLAFVPQERSIFPSLTVYENLEMGGYTMSGDRVLENIEKVFQHFPRLKERYQQKAGTLSGGERQMLGIARGLMIEPELLMLDEPSLGLAPKIVETVFEQIELIHESGTTIFLVEQNAHMALTISNTGFVMETGRIVLTDKASALLENEQVKKAYLGE